MSVDAATVMSLLKEVQELRTALCTLQMERIHDREEIDMLRNQVAALEGRIVPLEVATQPFSPRLHSEAIHGRISDASAGSVPSSLSSLSLDCAPASFGPPQTSGSEGLNASKRRPSAGDFWPSSDFVDNECNDDDTQAALAFNRAGCLMEELQLQQHHQLLGSARLPSKHTSPRDVMPRRSTPDGHPLDGNDHSNNNNGGGGGGNGNGGYPSVDLRGVKPSDIREKDIVDLAVRLLMQHGSVSVGKMGSLLHKAADNHALPALLKERYGGLKRFLSLHPEEFLIGGDHAYNPHISLRSFAEHPCGMGGMQARAKPRRRSSKPLVSEIKKIRSASLPLHNGAGGASFHMYPLGMFTDPLDAVEQNGGMSRRQM